MRRRGRFERQHRLPRLHGYRLVLLIACLIQAALSGFCWVMLARTCDTLPTQAAADVWRGDSDERFAQVSAFLPVDGKLTLDSVRSFRMTLEEQFVQNSMEAPEGGKLYTDAYSGRTSLSASGTSPAVVSSSARTVRMGITPESRGMPMSCMGTEARSAISILTTNSDGSISPSCRLPIRRMTTTRIRYSKIARRNEINIHNHRS